MDYVIITEKTFEKARKKIKENPGKRVILSCEDDELNRKIMEKEKVDIYLPSLKNRKDFQKQRNSGFNQVMAKIAKEKDILIGINVKEILESNGREKSEIITRIIQNIELCKKAKLKMVFIPKTNSQDGLSLGLSLGMPTWMLDKTF